MISEKPWESPKVQMILAIFGGKLTSIKPINIIGATYEKIPR